MSLDSFRVRKGLIVDGGSTTTGSATVNGSLILTGSTSGQINLTAPAVAGSQAYTLPTALPPVNNYVLTSQTDGTLGWAAGSTVTTTYTIDAASTTGGANFNLTGSDASVDTIKFASGTNVTVSQTDTSTITISSTDTNTTYNISASTTTGGANLNLNGSDSSVDSVKYASGTGVTVSSPDANTIGIAIGQSVGTTDTVTFNTVNANLTGNVTGTVSSLSNHTTTDLAEGTNLYYTDARARAALSGGTGVTYNSTTGQISIGQDVATTAIVTFNTVNANLTGNVTGTVSSLSNHTTTDLAEGTNLYYTDARARAALSAGTGISYNSTTGVISSTITQYTDAMARAALSATTSGDGSLVYNNTTGVFAYTGPDATNYRAAVSATTSGDGSLVYNSSTGVFAYTGPSATNYRAALSGGTGVTYNSSTGVIAIGQDVATTANVTFASVTTPTLKAADGTTALTLANTTGDVTANRYIQVNGNRILNSSGTPTFYFDTSGNASVANTFTVLGNIIKAWNGSASVTAITLSATGDVTTAGNLTVGGNNIKASDGTTAATLATSTGDITYASRLLSSASKTIRTGPNRTTSYASISGATSEDIITMGIGASGVPLSGILATNSGLATGSTAGRRQGVLIRNYGGNEYNGSMTTVPQGAFMCESSRGTYADPRSLASGNPLAIVQGYSNAGSDLSSGNTPYWTAEQYPVAPVYGLIASQIHKGPFGAGAGVTVFTATIAASSTSLVVSSVSLGTILIGQEIRLSSGANWATTTNSFQIIAQVSGTTGGAGTYTLNANPGTYTSPTVMWSVSTTLGANFIVNNQPQNTPLTTASRVQQVIGADGIIFRAQSANTSTNIFQVNSWPTTVFAGTGTGTSAGNFVQGSNKTYFAITDTTTTVGNTLAVSGTMKTTLTALNIQNSTNTNMISISSANTIFNTDNIEFRDSVGNFVTSDKLDYNRTYGEFAYTNATGFGIAAQNTIYTMPLDTSNFSSGVTISGTGSVNITVSGTYKLIMSLQAAMTTNTVGSFDFWLRKNGVDVTNSKTQVDLLKDQKSVIAMDWMVSSNGTDYWEIVYASSSANYADITFPTIAATASPYVSPLAPALILNVIPVGA
jgi:hypothetical protein